VVRAIKLSEPLKLDGRLDEAVYQQNDPIDGFLQTVPRNGEPVSERTEAWIMFDENYIYVAAKLYESVPPEQWIANELRRAGLRVELYPESPTDYGKKVGEKQFKYAAARGVPFVAVIGADELANGTVTVKNMKTGEQKTLPRAEVVTWLSN